MKKVLLKSMILFVAILFVGIAQAQTVTGTVSDESGPLPGANVIVKGTSNGATTDFDGNYTLNDVGSDAILVFSYVGFSNQEIAVNGQSVVNTVLSAASELDEVVLIGYGSTTIKDATGSVASVTSEDFNQGVIQSPEQLIQGKTAGVQISEASGEPGAGIAIRIRGNNSIRSGNDPLFVVDGVPLSGGGAPSVNVGADVQGSISGGNPLSFINPNDIESISILKDASATAIYGSRGANGVIIIQTKAGRGASKGVWELTTSVSSSKALNSYDLLNREQFLAATSEIGATVIDGGADSDWQNDFLTRNAFSRQTDLSYSKSYTGGNLRASFGYGNNNGILPNSNQERIAGRLNISQRLLDDKLLLSAQASISRVNRQAPPIDGTAGSTGDLIGASISQNPTFPIDPTYDPGGNVLNPASLLNEYDARTKSNRLLANLSAEYSFTNELSAKVTVGYDETNSEASAIYSRRVIGLVNTTGIGRGGFSEAENKNSLLEATINYKKDFENSALDILAGYSYQEFDNSGYNAQGAGFGAQSIGDTRGALSRQFGIVDNIIDSGYAVFGYGADGSFLTRLSPEIQTGLTLPTSFTRLVPAFTASIFNTVDELQSYFVRANYTIADKYLFTGTFRADGSSRFGDNERYGYFPSGAFAWKLSEEDFVGENVSTLKLRLGAGIVGSQEGLGFGNFLQIERANGGNIDNNLNVLAGGVPGTFIAGAFTNPDLKWEETTDFNLGLDFGFNEDRLNGSFNLYRKETRDLLLNQAIAAPSGGGTVFRNLEDGVVINQGIEFALNYDFIDTDDVSFGASFNIAYNQNEVQDTGLQIPTGAIRGNGLTGAFAQQLSAGQPLFSFFMAEFTGFDAEGNPTYTDTNGDGVGDPDADKIFVGKNAIPKVVSGLSLNARYKNFDISTYFTGQFGFHVYNATNNAFFTRSALSIGKNVPSQVANSIENPAASVAVSTRFLERGDFIRMQTASIGYNWPMSGEGLFDSLRLSLTGQNLFLITDYSGLDPEISQNTGTLNDSAIPTAGIDYASFPRARTFTLGVNARF